MNVNGETVLYAAIGFVDSNPVLIVCTNTRIIFLGRD
ncbi:PH domain-containing protein [Limosilactobacillus viscerum]